MPGESKPSPPVAPGYVRLTCDRPWMNITCFLGPENPRISSSDNGWEMRSRPKQTGMTVWNGVEPLQATFTAVLDGYATTPDNRRADRIFDPQTDNMEKLWQVCRGDADNEPGIIAIEGIPEFPNVDWIIESMTVEDEMVIRSETNFKQARAKITFVVREYNPPRYVPAKSPSGSPKGKTVTWKIKRKDTPASIARRIGCKWTEIRELNKKLVKKANQNLPDGKRIRVPATKDAIRLTRGKSAK